MGRRSRRALHSASAWPASGGRRLPRVVSARPRRGRRRTALAAGPLTIGLSGPLHVREERLSPRSDACRLMYVSDIHLRRNRSDLLCRQALEVAGSSELDALLLGAIWLTERT